MVIDFKRAQSETDRYKYHFSENSEDLKIQ